MKCNVRNMMAAVWMWGTGSPRPRGRYYACSLIGIDDGSG